MPRISVNMRVLVNQINSSNTLYIETPTNKELTSKLMLLEYENEDPYLIRYRYKDYILINKSKYNEDYLSR